MRKIKDVQATILHRRVQGRPHWEDRRIRQFLDTTVDCLRQTLELKPPEPEVKVRDSKALLLWVVSEHSISQWEYVGSKLLNIKNQEQRERE